MDNDQKMIFEFQLQGKIKRGALWSERTIWVKNNKLLYNKKHSKSGKHEFTINKYHITQNMDLQKNKYTFKIYEKISALYFLTSNNY